MGYFPCVATGREKIYRGLEKFVCFNAFKCLKTFRPANLSATNVGIISRKSISRTARHCPGREQRLHETCGVAPLADFVKPECRSRYGNTRINRKVTRCRADRKTAVSS
jgi:hypothetical protein